MQSSIKFFLAGAIPVAVAVSCSNVQEKEPNIMIILLDDAGYNDFGFMGCPDLLTPNIDALASQGIIFNDSHVSASVSGPSRCGLLTGRYQQRGGYECNLDNILGMDLKEETIADIFKRNGYHTSCFGKWHQGNGPEYHPNKRGFEHFYGFIAGSRDYFYNEDGPDRPGNVRNMQFNGEQVKFDGYLTDDLAEHASAYLKAQAENDEPFMMYLAFNAVHTPMQATDEDMERFKGHPRQKLAAMTWAVDRGIGKVINTLKETGEFDNTLIFFLNDNGGAFNNLSRNIPLKGYKGNKFEGGHRVPFFIVHGDRWHGHYDGLVSSLDILPTAMAAAGIDLDDVKNPLDGTDLHPYLNGEIATDPHEMLFWRKDKMAAVRMGPYKYIRVEGVGERLYNLDTNLDEDTDLCSLEPAIKEKMSSALCEWEKGLVNPLLWNEGDWLPTNINIHRRLMNNLPVDCNTPEAYFKKYGKVFKE